MRNLKVFPFALCAALLFAALAPVARTSERDKKTIVTFSDPVEIPGQVLEPGTYVFKLFDSPSNRNIVQVWNGYEDHLLATMQTVSDEQPKADDNSVFNIDYVSGEPAFALRSWFYAGERSGHQFLYPKYPTTEQATSTRAAR